MVWSQHSCITMLYETCSLPHHPSHPGTSRALPVALLGAGAGDGGGLRGVGVSSGALHKGQATLHRRMIGHDVLLCEYVRTCSTHPRITQRNKTCQISAYSPLLRMWLRRQCPYARTNILEVQAKKHAELMHRTTTQGSHMYLNPPTSLDPYHACCIDHYSPHTHATL